MRLFIQVFQVGNLLNSRLENLVINCLFESDEFQLFMKRCVFMRFDCWPNQPHKMTIFTCFTACVFSSCKSRTSSSGGLVMHISKPKHDQFRSVGKDSKKISIYSTAASQCYHMLYCDNY